MANIDPMYQYSLKWYEMIFQRSLDRAEAGAKQVRIGNIIREFTQQLYKNVCQSLFEKDKLLFSFLMCLKVMDEREELDQVENRFMLTGGIKADMNKPNPAPHWLIDKAWCTIEEMSEKLPYFEGFDLEFSENIHVWENIYNSSEPHNIESVPWPEKWIEDTPYHRIMILRVIRPDKVISAIQDLI